MRVYIFCNLIHFFKEPATEKINKYYVQNSLTPVKEVKMSPLKIKLQKIKENEAINNGNKIAHLNNTENMNILETLPKNE